MLQQPLSHFLPCNLHKLS
uniref:Hydroxyproline-rich glycoprotein n=1 Tax=Rhizophora mucronata TaxID=61149 RepID=A0A2P2JTC1_RHIMU